MAAAEPPSTGLDIAVGWVEQSPFCRVMGVRVERLEPDDVRLVLPYADERTTWGDMVHGGALSAFVDIAATAAAWSGAPLPEKVRGVTVSLSVNFLAPAHGEDVVADARVTRRGRSLCFCDVRMATAGGAAVGDGIVVYKIG